MVSDAEPTPDIRQTADASQSLLGIVGSLWFAAVLLMLLLVSMACATVYESQHGTEQALAMFYKSRWFEWLLALLGVNVLAALLVRIPFSKRQVGFVITHVSILVTLAGAAVTKNWGIDGQVALEEGQTTDHLSTWQGTLSVVSQNNGTSSSIDLTSSAFEGFRAVDKPSAPALTLGNLQVEVARYLPDSLSRRRVVNDNPDPRPAVEVSISETGVGRPAWVFADDEGSDYGHAVGFTVTEDPAAFDRLAAGAPETKPESIVIEHEGSTYTLLREECMGEPVPVGDIGYSIRVLRYLPHASVGSDRKLSNISDRPVNPVIEVELSGPARTETRLAFAKFPDFRSMHGASEDESVSIKFIAGDRGLPRSTIEILSDPQGVLHAGFRQDDGSLDLKSLTLGAPIEIPRSDRKLTVLRRFDHARVQTIVEPIDPPRETRQPAILVSLTAGENSTNAWVRKHFPHPVTIGGTTYNLAYANKTIPLGFSVTLDRFRVGHYPGSGQPRSFESHVTIADPETGRAQPRIISMNRPTSHRGYSLYQSQYRLERGHKTSYLSVSRDPGQPIVFTGYVGTTAGMLVVLATRISQRRRAGREATQHQKRAAGMNGEQTRKQATKQGEAKKDHRTDKPVMAHEAK